MKKINERWSTEDLLMNGITFRELIDTVYSNEKVVDEESITRCFNDLVQAQLKDAKFLLKKRMEEIKEKAKRD